MPRWAVWVLAALVVAPPLLLGGFLIWVNARPDGVGIGRGHLFGLYIKNPRGLPAQWGYELQVFPPSQGEGGYAHILRLGVGVYTIIWNDGVFPPSPSVAPVPDGHARTTLRDDPQH